MKLLFLPRFSSQETFFQHPLALLGGLLLCVLPTAAQAQSVTFAGAQTTLPASVFVPVGVAVDSAGDVFIDDDVPDGNLVELPRTATGYGPQTALPAGGFHNPEGIAVDSAGNVFIADEFNSRVVELPRTATGYGPQTTLSTNGLIGPAGVAVDRAGDVFIADGDYNRIVELPRTATGYGPQTTLPLGQFYATAVALDSGGNMFITDPYNFLALELPWTGTGYGTPVTLPTSGLYFPFGIAVDSAGDVFIADQGNNRVVELPRTVTGYGPQTTLPASGFGFARGVAVDSVGDIFITDGDNDRVLEVQTHSVNFGGVNVCAPGKTTPAPCSNSLTLNFKINADVTLGTTPNVLTGGAPNLDFRLASGSTCSNAVTEGTTCTVNVTFKPKFAGSRAGAVQILDESGNVLATTLIYGTGISPQIAFTPGPQITLPFSGLKSPNGIAVDAAGDVFVSDDELNEVLELPSGDAPAVRTFSGLPGALGVAVDGAGNLFVGDDNGTKVVELPAGGAQITLPFGLDGGSFEPYGVAVDVIGDVFVSNFVNNEVLELPAGGSQIALPVSGLQAPQAVATVGVAVDVAGNVFVAQEDSSGGQVLELPARAAAWTPLPISGTFFGPSGVAVDAVGDVLTVDDDHDLVWELQPGGGAQTTFPFSGLTAPTAVAADEAGDVFVVGNNNPSEVTELERSNPPALIFAPTPVGTSDSPQSVQIQNIGNAPLSLSGLSVSANFDMVPGPGTPADCTAGSSLPPGESCNISVSFAPVATTPLAGTLTLTDNTLNSASTTHVISLSGTGQGPAAQVSTSLLAVRHHRLREHRGPFADGQEYRRRHPHRLAVDQRPQLHNHVKHLRSWGDPR